MPENPKNNQTIKADEHENIGEPCIHCAHITSRRTIGTYNQVIYKCLSCFSIFGN